MKIYNLTNGDNVSVTKSMGVFEVFQHKTDLSQDSPEQARNQYYMQHQGIHKRQLVAKLNGEGVILQAGAMQWIAGKIKSVTDVKGIGDLIGKAFRGKVTGEAAINPLYKGYGAVFCEPTYKHILLEDVGQHGGLVVRDGVFYACEETVEMAVSTVKTLSGAIAGNMGLFNLALRGHGTVALESPIPEEELIKVELENGDEVRLDGPFALMWDDELTMSVERSGKTLIGSAVGGEGLVNVFRGVGCVWLTTAAAAVKGH